MIQAILPFLTAIVLSTIAAYYSVIGLAQIFPGSFLPIVIMGASLELAKLVTVSWVYNNWKQTSLLLKSYFCIAVVLLMLITSMGIFGFLARSHIETNVVVGANSVQLDVLNEQEKIIKNRLTFLLNQNAKSEKVNPRLERDIKTAQDELMRVSKEKAPLLAEENKLKSEIGPIQYVAELFYEKNDPDLIEKAVRLVILVIIFVFDPLAVLLLIAANQAWRNRNKPTPSVDRSNHNDVKSSEDFNNLIISKDKIAKINSGDIN